MSNLASDLLAFRAAHSVKELQTDGTTWRYFLAGSGPGFLLLPGGLGEAEMTFAQITALARHHTVVSISYPPVQRMDEMVRGILRILDAEKLPVVDLLGGSYGGLVAQMLVRAAPDRVRSLILSHTGTPDPRRNRTMRRVLTALRFMPMPVTRWLFGLMIPKLLRPLPSQAARRFWRDYIKNILRRLSRADLASSYTRVIDFNDAGFQPHDLDAWPGRVLILESSDDPMVKRAHKDALRALYPRAVIHTFADAGHIASLLKPDEYLGMVMNFVDGRR